MFVKKPLPILMIDYAPKSLKSELEPAIIGKLSTCQRIPSKKHSNSVGRYLSLRYGQEILVSRNTILTAVN